MIGQFLPFDFLNNVLDISESVSKSKFEHRFAIYLCCYFLEILVSEKRYDCFTTTCIQTQPGQNIIKEFAFGGQSKTYPQVARDYFVADQIVETLICFEILVVHEMVGIQN